MNSQQDAHYFADSSKDNNTGNVKSKIKEVY